MVAALECYFDVETTRRMWALWGALEEAGVPTLQSLTHGQHRPHLSLVVAPSLDPGSVAAALGGLRVPPPLALEFGHVGVFVGRVVWLGPVPSAELLAHHEAVHRRLAAVGIEIDPLYAPAAWVPHSTVSIRVPRPLVGEALQRCLETLPIPARLVGAAVADHARGLYHPLGRDDE